MSPTGRSRRDIRLLTPNRASASKEIRRETVMKLSTKGRYAVMAMADLAANGREGRAVPLVEIAERQEISLSYLAP